MRFPVRAVRSLALLLAVFSCLWGCGGESIVDTEAGRLWRAAVWQPSRHAFGPAREAAVARLRTAGADATDDERWLAGAAAMLEGDFAAGVPLVDDVLQRDPGRPGVLLMQGFWHSSRHSRPEAKTQFTACIDALEARPESEPFAAEVRFLAYLFRGQERYLLRDFVGAISDLQVAWDLHAERDVGVHRELVRFLADAHVHGQEYGPAEAVLRDALAAEPETPAFHFQLGMVLAAQVRTEEAAACYRKVVELSPGDPAPRVKLAEIARRDGDLPSMRRELDGLLSFAPEGTFGGELSAALGSYWIEMGRESAAEGDDAAAEAAFGRARRHLLRAVDANPLCTRAFTLLIQVCGMLGAPADEIERYKKRLEEIDHAKSGAPAASDPHRTFC